MPSPWKLKTEMCEIGRRMYSRGLIAAFEGNLSVRLGPDRVLCTPTLICKGFLKPEDLCTVDMDGKQISGQSRRTSEVLLHLAIYRQREDVQAVVHAHPPHALAFALTHEPIPKCLLAEVEAFLGEVPTAPYATPGTQEFADTVAPFVGQANAILLANHGTVSYEKSLEQALFLTEILESYCRMLILSRQLGTAKQLSEQNIRDILALKQRLGLPDRRTGLEDCDLCGNDVVGRGYEQQQPGAVAGTSDETGPAAATAAELEALVQRIADRVLSEVSRR